MDKKNLIKEITKLKKNNIIAFGDKFVLNPACFGCAHINGSWIAYQTYMNQKINILYVSKINEEDGKYNAMLAMYNEILASKTAELRDLASIMRTRLLNQTKHYLMFFSDFEYLYALIENETENLLKEKNLENIKSELEEMQKYLCEKYKEKIKRRYEDRIDFSHKSNFSLNMAHTGYNINDFKYFDELMKILTEDYIEYRLKNSTKKRKRSVKKAV